MRADRLLSLLLMLQSRGRVTAAQVAVELEISLATARRDLAALSTAGIPVYPQSGRGGGWQLVGGARTDLSGLSGHEARALFWMLGTAGLADPQTRLATKKLIRALPESIRAEAERLASSIHYDHAPWGTTRVTASGGLDSLRDAIVQRRVIRFSYRSRSGTRSSESAHPLGLVAKAGVWYLVADRGAAHQVHRPVRSFRVDRIDEVEVGEQTFTAPNDFDLVDYWADDVEQIERERSAVAAELSVPGWVAPLLQQQFGTYCTRRGPMGVDRELVEVRAHRIDGLAEQLAGWSAHLEVIEPPELRSELARIGRELVDRFG